MKKSQIRQLDKLWSQRIKELAKYKCEFCLEEGIWLNSCHIIGRTNRTLRWDLRNGVCLCFLHHKAYDEHGKDHERIINLAIGRKRYNNLFKVKEVISKNQDYEQILKTLEK
jgi:predicted restriction endonuclease